MTINIIKSPSPAGRRVSIGSNLPRRNADAKGLPSDQLTIAPAFEESPEALKWQAQLRKQFEQEFESKLEAIKEQAYEAAYKEGFESGHADGFETASETFKKHQLQLEKLITECESAWADQVADLSASAADLAFESVCRVIGEHVVDAEGVASMVGQLIAPLRDADVLKIRLHPAECNSLRAALHKGAVESLSPRLLEKLTEDATLQAGGCIVETPRGDYRAPLDVQLRRLKEVLNTQREQLDIPSESVRDVRRA